MTNADYFEQAPVEPFADESAMLRSLVVGLSDVQASLAALQAQEATLYAAAVELIELQTSRLGDRARAQREMPLRTACGCRPAAVHAWATLSCIRHSVLRSGCRIL